MNLEQLKANWRSEEQKTFKGWDFSHLDKRWELQQLPWDYKLIVLNYIKPSNKLLDMCDDKCSQRNNMFTLDERIKMWNEIINYYILSHKVYIVPIKRPEYNIKKFNKKYLAINMT